MDKPNKNAPWQLIVEGIDDLYFFAELQVKMAQAGQLTRLAHIHKIDGKNNIVELREVLSSFALRRDVNAIGLIRDADDDPQAAFQSWTGAVSGVGLPVPARIGQITQTQPRVGILVLPPDRPGIRETLCLEAVQGDTAMPCIDDYIACLQNKLAASHFPHSEAKARLGAYLASRREAEFRTGVAIKNGTLPWDSPAFAPIHDFLRRLIG